MPLFRFFQYISDISCHLCHTLGILSECCIDSIKKTTQTQNLVRQWQHSTAAVQCIGLGSRGSWGSPGTGVVVEKPEVVKQEEVVEQEEGVEQ